MAERGWLRRHVIETIVGTVIVLVIGAIWVSPTLREFLKGMPGYLSAFFQGFATPVETYRWWYWTLTLIAVMVAALALAVLVAAMRTRSDHYAYTTEKLYGVVWRWHWPLQGFVHPDDLRPYCPQCDRLLRLQADETPMRRDITTFHCDACGKVATFNGHVTEMHNSILTEIDLKRRNGTWKNSAVLVKK